MSEDFKLGDVFLYYEELFEVIGLDEREDIHPWPDFQGFTCENLSTGRSIYFGKVDTMKKVNYTKTKLWKVLNS